MATLRHSENRRIPLLFRPGREAPAGVLSGSYDHLDLGTSRRGVLIAGACSGRRNSGPITITQGTASERSAGEGPETMMRSRSRNEVAHVRPLTRSAGVGVLYREKPDVRTATVKYGGPSSRNLDRMSLPGTRVDRPLSRVRPGSRVGGGLRGQEERTLGEDGCQHPPPRRAARTDPGTRRACIAARWATPDSRSDLRGPLGLLGLRDSQAARRRTSPFSRLPPGPRRLSRVPVSPRSPPSRWCGLGGLSGWDRLVGNRTLMPSTQTTGHPGVVRPSTLAAGMGGANPASLRRARSGRMNPRRRVS
jgi:hypothetical protein